MARMIGTGRLNASGGAGTLTVPKAVRDKYGVTQGDGIDVVYFEDGDRLVIKPASEVEL